MANAGSGKTTTYIQRIRRMISSGIASRSIVAITFTNAAANEINHRLNADGQVDLGYIGTLHGFMARLLQRHGSAIGLPPKLTVLDEEEADELLKWAAKRMSYKGSAKALNEAVSLGMSHYRSGKFNLWSTPAGMVAYEFFYQMVSAGSLSFDSILDLGLELVSNPSVWPELIRYKHLLVDEYQDGCQTDARIYNSMPFETRFYVGDPDQSIMGFRGSDVEVILEENYRTDTMVLGLNENYRSGWSICSAANCLISHNLNRIKKELVPATAEHGVVTVNSYATATHELSSVCAKIEQCINLHNIPPTDIAVLCRTNLVASQFAKNLEDLGLPVQKRKRVDMPHDWGKARAFIAMVNNPESDSSALRYLKMSVGDAKADEMRKEATANYQSVNERFLKIGAVELGGLPTALNRAGISAESLQRINAVAATLAPGAGILELALALTRADALEAETGEGVTVTTIHSAKGREFGVVFLPAWESGVFPVKSCDNIEEERRIAFVGVTRAKHQCHVSYALRRATQWSKEPETHEPNPFVRELTNS